MTKHKELVLTSINIAVLILCSLGRANLRIGLSDFSSCHLIYGVLNCGIGSVLGSFDFGRGLSWV